jgi:Protein of unknown function (DUF3150)
MQTLNTSARTRKEKALSSILGAFADWRVLAQDGVLVKVSIGRCGFTAKLELSDLGVTVQEGRVRQAMARTLILGDKRLLPDSYMSKLSQIESQARHLLAKNSFYIKASGFVLGYFLPVTAYGDWKKETEACKTRYLTLRDDIVANYDTLVEQMMKEYEIVARDTYQRIQEARTSASDFMSEEAFVASYCDRIVTLIPSKEHIMESFKFDIELMETVKSFDNIAQEDGASVGATQVRTQAEGRAGLREQMQRDLLVQMQAKKKSVVDSFLTTIVAQLRSLTYEAVTDVLSSMERRGENSFPPRSLVQLKNLVEQLNQLSFYGDQDIERFMAQIQGILDQQPKQRNRSLAEIQSKLRDIATVARATLLDLEVDPRTSREEGIPDAPTEKSVREARQQLGLDLNEADFSQLFEARPGRDALEVELWDWVDGNAQMRETRIA